MPLAAIRHDGAVAVLTFARPQAANALNRELSIEIKAFFDGPAKDCRAVILTGEGRHFCAGADLKERQGMDEAAWHAQHAAFEGALRAIMDCPIPVIAVVNGTAMGGGLELALACDFLYAADTARFALPETGLGIMPGLGGTQALPRAVGMARAKEIIFTGAVFSAQEALEWGLVNHVYPADRLMAEALACARSIAARAPLAIRAVKKAMEQGRGLPMDRALACELACYETLLATADRHEGINAFNEKRKPAFSGM